MRYWIWGLRHLSRLMTILIMRWLSLRRWLQGKHGDELDERLVAQDCGAAVGIAVLVDQPQGAGAYTVLFDATDLAAGIYIYRIVTRPHVSSAQTGYEDSGKMLLLR